MDLSPYNFTQGFSTVHVIIASEKRYQTFFHFPNSINLIFEYLICYCLHNTSLQLKVHFKCLKTNPVVLSMASNKASVPYHLQKTFSSYTIICVYEELLYKQRIYWRQEGQFCKEAMQAHTSLLNQVFPAFFFFSFYEIFLIQCPKGIQKGSGHFSELPLTENHF